jgi:ketosteroid isomerase-like protein
LFSFVTVLSFPKWYKRYKIIREKIRIHGIFTLENACFCATEADIYKDELMKTNLETIQGIYKGDAEQIAKNLQSALAPRFEWTEAAGFPYAGTYHSMEEVGKNVFARLATEWDGYRAEVDKFYDAGDAIIVTGRYLGTYKKSGGVMDAVFAHIWNFKDGKIVKYTQNVDTKKVWDAIEGK